MESEPLSSKELEVVRCSMPCGSAELTARLLASLDEVSGYHESAEIRLKNEIAENARLREALTTAEARVKELKALLASE
jgi:hypothetical protein